MAAGCRLEQDISREIENVRIDGREDHWGGAEKPVLTRLCGWRNVLHSARGSIVATNLAAINVIRIEWINGDVAIFLSADGMKLTERDLAVVAATGNSCRAALLLATVNPIRELVVGADVVELGGWLIVPGAPGFPTVDGDNSSLVAGQKYNLPV